MDIYAGAKMGEQKTKKRKKARTNNCTTIVLVAKTIVKKKV